MGVKALCRETTVPIAIVIPGFAGCVGQFAHGLTTSFSACTVLGATGHLHTAVKRRTEADESGGTIRDNRK